MLSFLYRRCHVITRKKNENFSQLLILLPFQYVLLLHDVVVDTLLMINSSEWYVVEREENVVDDSR